jgi:hypothetical protein
MRKQTVLCVSPDPNDATSFYRGSGAIGMMRKLTDEFEFAPCPKGMTITWSVLQQADWLFLQRPFTRSHLKMAQMAKQNGLKVWCDWDDDILNIPRSNYTHKIYLSKNARENITQIVNECADLMTVSTEHLAGIFGAPVRGNTHVVPNALNTDLFNLETRQEWLDKQKGPLKRKRVFWRGGKTHVEDLMVYEDPIKQVINENHDIEFGFCGETDWPLLDALEGCKNVHIYEPQDVVEYHHTYKNYAAQVAWVPLKACDFNNSKSMCAWLEATYAGAACLGPDFDEWKRPGITNYSDESSFYDRMTELLKDNVKCQNLQAESVKTIIDDGLTLKHTASKRLELLRQYS